jgi:hypothetical protein
LELRILQGPLVVHAEPLGRAAVHVGRASSNELVLRDPGVSGHHAVLYLEGEVLFVRDLGSTNGTFVNGIRVHEPAALTVGDRLRFGLGQEALIARGEPPPLPALRLERADAPVGWTVTRTPFVVPGTSDAELVVMADEIWLARDGLEVQRLEVGDRFEVDGVPFVLRADDTTPQPARPAGESPPYAVWVDLADGRAEVRPLAGHTPEGAAEVCRIDTDNRVALLFALGRCWLDTNGEGWLDDDQAALGVWGRSHHEQGRNNLNVLVHRIRKQLTDAGYDRWLVERRTGQLRLSVRRVELVGDRPAGYERS